LKVKDIKTIEELPKLTEKPLAKERNEMVKKKKECGIRNPCALPTSKKICQVKKEFISNNLV
jgi:hypothetical protein